VASGGVKGAFYRLAMWAEGSGAGRPAVEFNFDGFGNETEAGVNKVASI
jgi:hypothetical protein